MHRHATARRGFTLIELLVVIGILALLAGLGVLIVANINNESRAPRGAGQIQQWLLIQKQSALRNRRPAGLRLLPRAANPNLVTELQYIEQPDDFIVLPGVQPDPFNAGRMLPFRRIWGAGNIVTLEDPGAGAPNPPPDFTGGFGAASTLWPVLPGDYIEINGGLPQRINSVAATALTLDSPLVAAIPQTEPTASYRILRAPRVVGEEQLQLPADIAVDLSTDSLGTLPRDPVTGNIDILFSPTGAVVGRGTRAETIYLWVRDTAIPSPLDGDPTILAIYVRSGAIAAHPVDRGTDPYAFTKDGRASGL